MGKGNNAFISYSHAVDGRLAPALQKAIKRFAIPWYKRSKLEIFIDESSLSVSPHLWSNIEGALANSEYLIYLASPESAKSKWVAKELDYWINNKSIEKLIIVLTDGEIMWDQKTNTFQQSKMSSISEQLNKSFTQEPFYIDLRTLRTEDDLSLKNSIFNKEILKITAELYGISQEKMAGDEVNAQKKVKRITIAIFGILLLAFITTFFFYKKSVSSQKLAEENKEKVSDLLQITLQGRGDRYASKPIDTIIKILEFERVRPIRELIKTKALREAVGTNNNYDYLIWIDVPSFRLDSIVRVEYSWPDFGYEYARGFAISKEPSTGFAFGYRGTNAIKNSIYINVVFKDSTDFKQTFFIRDELSKLYGISVEEKN